MDFISKHSVTLVPADLDIRGIIDGSDRTGCSSGVNI